MTPIVIRFCSKCHNAGCCYAEWRCAECRGALARERKGERERERDREREREREEINGK
jgi:hypothetical protein